MRAVHLNQFVMYNGLEWTVESVYDDCLSDMCTIKRGSDLYVVSIAKLTRSYTRRSA